MYINEFEGDPWSEAQHIYEVMQRGNPLKGLSIKGGIIQIEQTNRRDAEEVLNFFKSKGYVIESFSRCGSGYVAGIKLKTKEEKEKDIER